MEWARKLSCDDIGVLSGKHPYSETMPDFPDDGFDADKLVNLNNMNFNNNAQSGLR